MQLVLPWSVAPHCAPPLSVTRCHDKVVGVWMANDESPEPHVGPLTKHRQQIIEYIKKSLNYTPFETRWVPSSNRFIAIGSYPRYAAGLASANPIGSGRQVEWVGANPPPRWIHATSNCDPKGV